MATLATGILPQSHPRPAGLSGRTCAAICATLILLSGALSYVAALSESPTFDEPLHAVSGYLVRWMRDYRLDVEDPALFTLASTLTHARSDLAVDGDDPNLAALLAEHGRQWDVTMHTLFRTPENNGVAYIQRARLTFTIIGLMLGGLIAWWAYELGGWTTSLIATSLYSFDPNFLAHSALVKNDVAISLLMLWLMHSLWKLGQRITLGRIVRAGVACAIGINVKFSAILFAPLVIILLMTRALSADAWPAFSSELRSRALRCLGAAAICALVGLISWAGIWATYRFRFSMSADPQLTFHRDVFVLDAKLRQLMLQPPEFRLTRTQVEEMPLVLPLRTLLWCDDHHLLPDAWIWGLFYTYNTSLYRASFLLGEHSLTGWWYYFPVAMFFKTPTAVLMLTAALLALAARKLILPKRFAFPSWTTLCLWLPIVLYAATAMSTNLNLGIRHVLPLYPFIYLLLAKGLGRLIESYQPIRIAAVVLMLANSVEVLSHWPHEISFFNLFAGGSRGGIRLLGDSNIDWGQDLPLLAAWQKQHAGTPLYLGYFGSADPHAYGMTYLQMDGGYPFSDQVAASLDQPGVVAISATFLQGTYSSETMAERLRYLQTLSPRDVLGGSLYLYDWSPAMFNRFRQSQHPH